MITQRVFEREFGLNGDIFLLLSVGELHERRNHKVVFKALHRLNNPKIVYFVVGEGELEKNYKHKVKTYGLEDNIRFLGFRKDVEALCSIADCFAHPSVREGFGIAPVEAMVAGLPLIVSNVNGIKDYAENDKTGICVNPRSSKEMSKAIERIYMDKEFRQRSRYYNLHKSKNYSIEKIGTIMRHVYMNLL